MLAMLGKLGRKTAFLGKVGEDQFGKLLKETIEEVGVDTTGLRMDQEIPTTLAFVHTFPDGDRDFSFYRKPGADMMLREEEVDVYKRQGYSYPVSGHTACEKQYGYGACKTREALNKRCTERAEMYIRDRSCSS